MDALYFYPIIPLFIIGYIALVILQYKNEIELTSEMFLMISTLLMATLVWPVALFISVLAGLAYLPKLIKKWRTE